MPLGHGPRLTIAHLGMGRWNRQPLKTGSSEHDDRVGGGVSLSAVSDFDDDRQVPSASKSKSSSNTEKSNTAMSSDSSSSGAKLTGPTLFDVQSEEMSRQASPASSVSTDDSVSPANSTSEEAAKVCLLITSSSRIHRSVQRTIIDQFKQIQMQNATLALMEMYNAGKRIRSATTPSHDYSLAMDLTSDHPGNGISTAHSSPIKHMVRRNTGVSENQQHCNGNTPFEHQSHTSSHAPSTPNSSTYRLNLQATNGQHLDRVHLNAKASVFNPTYESMQSAQMSNPKASPGYHGYNHQNGLSAGSLKTANAMQAMPVQPGPGCQGQQTHGLFEDRVARNHQGQLQGPMNGNGGYIGHGGYPPMDHVNGYHMPQGQIRERSMSYTDDMLCNERVYHDPWQYRVINQNPAMSVNGGAFHSSNAQNTAPTGGRGYNHGLPGSASDGSMSQYYPSSLSNVSSAMVQYDHEPVAHCNSVGPLRFDLPTKQILASRSEMLQTLTENGQPSLEDVLDTRFIPFIENYRYSSPMEENGVIVIKNVSPPTIDAFRAF